MTKTRLRLSSLIVFVLAAMALRSGADCLGDLFALPDERGARAAESDSAEGFVRPSTTDRPADPAAETDGPRDESESVPASSGAGSCADAGIVGTPSSGLVRVPSSARTATHAVVATAAASLPITRAWRCAGPSPLSSPLALARASVAAPRAPPSET